MRNRKYCCYRHFKQGKHDLSCTYCNDHVQLGVINPVHSPAKQPYRQQTPPLNVRSKPFRIENRTHDYNEVQNKDSLPQRLTKPRVYVEKILDKNERNPPLLPIKLTGSAQYEQTVKLFRKIGQSLPQKTKHCLTSLIRSHCLQKMYVKASQQTIFLTKPQFIEFLITNFKKFNHTQAELFWNISYNQLRFKDRISMEAFVFNFSKFYLHAQNINNTFSQPALRQRMIDLRVLLFDWAQNEVNLKYNLREMRQQIKQIENTLKLSSNQEALADFHMAIQKCRVAHIKLRFLSDILFKMTDNKFLFLGKLKLAIQLKIEQKVRKLQTSRHLIQKYFQTNNLAVSQKFPITDLIQFCRTEKCTEQQIHDMISWIQGMFDYLYYNKPEDDELGLTLNLETKRLQCVNILHIDSNMVREYDRFAEKLSDVQVDFCQEMLAVVEDGLLKMPALTGHKKDVVECNYVVELVLRYVRAIDLSPFWRLTQIIHEGAASFNDKKVEELLKTKPADEEIKKCMKALFTINMEPVIKDQEQLGIKPLADAQKQPIHSSLQKYRLVKQQQLLMKTKADPKDDQEQKKKKSEYGVLDEILKENEKNNNEANPDKEEIQNVKNPGINCCSKYWLDASRQTNQTIASVESLESQLFSLLDLNDL